MRTSTVVMIGFAVVFGLLAVFLANSWLNNRADEAVRNLEAQHKAAPPARTLVVAAKPLRFGDTLNSSSLREIPWPQDAVPDGAFAKISELIATKRIVLMPIQINEAILASKVTGPGQRATLSALLHDDMKAVTIRVNDVAGVAGFVEPGDRVDVALSRPGDKKVSINDVIVQNARVLGVDQIADQAADKPAVVKAVTLEVNENEGQKLALSSIVGSLSLMLRKAGEVANGETRQVSVADLANQTAPAGNAGFVTVIVTRANKDSTSDSEYSVPVAHRAAPVAARRAPELAHK